METLESVKKNLINKHKELDVACSLIMSLLYAHRDLCEKKLKANFSSGDDTYCKKGEYYFIPLDYGAAINALQEVARLRGSIGNFIDVGCGMGWVSKLAQQVHNRAMNSYSPNINFCGLEKDVTHKELGEALLGKTKWIKGDMLRFNRYGEFDTIYFYVPMFGEGLMNKWWKRTKKQLKPNTYLICQGWDPIHGVNDKDVSHVKSANCSSIFVFKPTDVK